MRMKGTATVRKRALTLEDLQLVVNHYRDTSIHDDLLFLSMLLTGFFGLLRLGELVFPDEASLQNWKKVTRRNTVHIQDDLYEFLLPGHKADRFFRVIRLSSLLPDSNSTHSITLQDTLTLETLSTRLHPRFGLHKPGPSPLAHFSSPGFVSFSRKMSLATPCVQEALHP